MGGTDSIVLGVLQIQQSFCFIRWWVCWKSHGKIHLFFGRIFDARNSSVYYYVNLWSIRSHIWSSAKNICTLNGNSHWPENFWKQFERSAKLLLLRKRRWGNVIHHEGDALGLCSIWISKAGLRIRWIGKVRFELSPIIRAILFSADAQLWPTCSVLTRNRYISWE